MDPAGAGGAAVQGFQYRPVAGYGGPGHKEEIQHVLAGTGIAVRVVSCAIRMDMQDKLANHRPSQLSVRMHGVRGGHPLNRTVGMEEPRLTLPSQGGARSQFLRQREQDGRELGDPVVYDGRIAATDRMHPAQDGGAKPIQGVGPRLFR